MFVIFQGYFAGTSLKIKERVSFKSYRWQYCLGSGTRAGGNADEVFTAGGRLRRWTLPSLAGPRFFEPALRARAT